MKLLSLKLNGQYKGLKDQYFDFSRTQGNIVALIGLNGSGKSQLLELVAEIFGYLERDLRKDYKCRNWFPSLAIEICYANQPYDSEGQVNRYSVNINEHGIVTAYCDDILIDLGSDENSGIEEQILPSQVIGYSSGLNENLQRAFLKNTVQFLDVMNVRRAWERRLSSINQSRDERGKYLTEGDIDLIGEKFSEAYDYYQTRHPSIFPPLPQGSTIVDLTNIGLRATPLPRLKYFDQDTTTLMLASMGMLPGEVQLDIWQGKQRFNKIHSVKFRYDLRKFTYDTGALLDIAKLIDILADLSSCSFQPLPSVSKTSEEFFDQFELDYLAGELTIDFSDHRVRDVLESSFFTSQVLFEKLYRLHLLAADFWKGETKRELRQDNFDGSAKRPQKWKSPINVLSLKLTDGHQYIEFDDLSDGEAQLIQILSMAHIYKDSRALFLLDEPETHLNPSWRTYFHSFVEGVVGEDNEKGQLFISTHSPFMVSSLKREDVMLFERTDNGLIQMKPVDSQTYGASFEVLIKNHFGLRSLISQTVVEAVKEFLPKDERPESLAAAREWIEENLGDSMEKAYLLRKLQS
ncbi:MULTISPECIES: AAA family ATPase [Vibrio harveyi group]|uniref:AAA family ATPase n=1 Tax=Vibrio harveyi group TaxID=717610 RepID=UPI001EFC4098|nr:AAA family ATPase [Vibrio diabolicus]MCG9762371.1 AAA family ATPase [Vibrio alginolyticus]MCS0323023.1 AAA family ATPase [Vibrio diabolicus]